MVSEEWAEGDGERRHAPVQNNDFDLGEKSISGAKPSLTEVLKVFDKYRAKIAAAKFPAAAASFILMLLMELLKFLPGLKEILDNLQNMLS